MNKIEWIKFLSKPYHKSRKQHALLSPCPELERMLLRSTAWLEWDRAAGCLIGCECHALKLLRLPSPLLSCFGLVVNVARVGLKIKKAHSLSLDKKTNRVYPSGCKKRKHQTELRQQQSGNKIIYNCNRQFTLQLQCGCCCYELPVSHAVVAACVCSRRAIGFVG